MKLPLHIDGRNCIRNREGKDVILTQATGHDGRGCLVESSEDLRDKEFIVLACNAHDKLVAALEAYHRCNRLHNDAEADLFEQAREALKQAKGE